MVCAASLFFFLNKNEHKQTATKIHKNLLFEAEASGQLLSAACECHFAQAYSVNSLQGCLVALGLSVEWSDISSEVQRLSAFLGHEVNSYHNNNVYISYILSQPLLLLSIIFTARIFTE